MLTLDVIIPTYNRGQDLFNTVNLLLKQSVVPNKIIIVDQTQEYPHDNVENIDYIKSFDVVVYCKESVPNAARAKNIGFRKSGSDVLLFLDDDVEFDQYFVENHLKNFNDSAVDAVQGVVKNKQGEGIYKAVQKLSLTHNECVEFINLPAGNFSVKKSVIDKLGGFDERFVYSSTHEDKDFSLRFHKSGFVAVSCREASLVHLFSPGGGRTAKKNPLLPTKQRLIPQNLFYIKNMSFLKSFEYIYKYIISSDIFTAYKIKHPVLLCKSFYIFLKSYIIAYYIYNSKNFDFKKFR